MLFCFGSLFDSWIIKPNVAMLVRRKKTVARKLMFAHSVYASFLFVVGGCLAVSHCHADDRGLAVTALWKGER